MPGLPQWDHLGMTRGLRWTPEQKAAYEQGKQLATPERMDAKQAQDADSPSGQFARQLDAAGIKYELEYKFHPERKWRFDFMLNNDCFYLLALEINGGNWAGGRHVRPAALIKEYEKLNSAVLLGWRVLLVTPEDVTSGRALELVRRALG